LHAAIDGEHMHDGQLAVGGVSANPGAASDISGGHAGGVAFDAPIHRRLTAYHSDGAGGRQTPVQLPGPPGPPASRHFAGSFEHGSGLLQAAPVRTRARSGEKGRIGLTITVGNRR
jgi:hypothetical protein